MAYKNAGLKNFAKKKNKKQKQQWRPFFRKVAGSLQLYYKKDSNVGIFMSIQITVFETGIASVITKAYLGPYQTYVMKHFAKKILS